MPFTICRNDITKMKVDAIVNSANPGTFIGAGVDSAIHSAAGPELMDARSRFGEINEGDAIATPAFNLQAKYVIHTVGPLWRDGNCNEMQIAARCYTASLNLAVSLNCKSIAFPLISTGTYGFPKAEALQIAITEIGKFLLNSDMNVNLVVYDRESYELSDNLYEQVIEYIDDNYIANRSRRRRTDNTFDALATFTILSETTAEMSLYPKGLDRRLEDLVNELEETFSQSLLRLIDLKGMSDVEVYRRANLDRKLFSKIRSNKDYRPKKATAIALSIALRLNLDETRDLIARAGYALTRSSKFDIVIEFFIYNEIYDIYEINKVLFGLKLPLIGA